MSFSAWVKDTRASKQLSQEECAARAGVHQSVWSEYEKAGTRSPRRSTVEKIAFALGVDTADALEVAGYHVASIEVPPRLLRAWRKVANASEAKQSAWLDSVDRSADLAISI